MLRRFVFMKTSIFAHHQCWPPANSSVNIAHHCAAPAGWRQCSLTAERHLSKNGRGAHYYSCNSPLSRLVEDDDPWKPGAAFSGLPEQFFTDCVRTCSGPRRSSQINRSSSLNYKNSLSKSSDDCRRRYTSFSWQYQYCQNSSSAVCKSNVQDQA